LRQGTASLILDEKGKISFTDHGEGLKRARYFNALLNPAGDLKFIFDLLRSPDILAPVMDILGLLKAEVAQLVTDLRLLLQTGETILNREGIKEPGDLIPRPMLARVLSLMLRGNYSLDDQLEPLIQQITECRDFPRVPLKKLLQQENKWQSILF